MPINPIPQPVDVIINPSGEPPKIKDFIINAPLIVQSTNVKNKLDSLDSTSENLSQRVTVLENRPIATASGPSGDYVPTSRTINSHALTADITITKSDLGLANVDNTSDINKPVSTAQAVADAAVLATALAADREFGTGTFASRPVSPDVGDTYIVTSGINMGDYYVCTTDNAWELLKYDRSPLAPGAVARWQFDDAHGLTVDDSLDGNNLGVQLPEASFQILTPWSNGVSTRLTAIGPFGGSVSQPSGAANIQPAAVTVLLWVYRVGIVQDQWANIFLKRQSTYWSPGAPPMEATIALVLRPSSDPVNPTGPVAYAYDNSNAVIYAVPSSGGSPTSSGKWFRFAVSYSAAGGLILYRNGIQIGVGAATGNPLGYNGVDSFVWCFGGNMGVGLSNPTANQFDGYIRDVQICNQVLTPTQILEDYERGAGKKQFILAP